MDEDFKDKKASRMMRSQAARKHRAETRNVCSKKEYREEREILHLEEKYKNIEEMKRNAAKKQQKAVKEST